MSEESSDHPSVPAPTRSDAAHIARLAAGEQHQAAARHQAGILVARAQTLARNGVDLRHPERLTAFANDQVMEAVAAAAVPGCGCGGSHGTAAVALVAELARQLAEATR